MLQIIMLFLILIIITSFIKKWEEKQQEKNNTLSDEVSKISDYEFYKLKEEVEELKMKILKMELKDKKN